MTKKIFISMATTPDGDRVFGSAYLSYKAAENAAIKMIEEISNNIPEWELTPIVEDIDLIEESEQENKDD